MVLIPPNPQPDNTSHMDPLETLTGIGGTTLTFLIIAFSVFMIVYAIMTFLLPFIVWGILRRTRATNEILEKTSAQLLRSQFQASEEAKALFYQLELNLAALQRIKDSGDGLLTHTHTLAEAMRLKTILEAYAANP